MNALLNQSAGDDFPEPHMEREVRGVPGGGIVRAVIAVMLVAACAALALGLAC